jgi:AcrR family transcriptional regulator
MLILQIAPIVGMHVTVSETGYPRKRARTRRRLLRAGMAVLARRGPEGATVGEIAGAAGVATGTFYNHFPSLADLVTAITEDLAVAMRVGVAELDAMEHDPAARVALATLQLLDAADEDPVFADAFCTLVNSLEPFRRRVMDLVLQVVRDGATAGRFDVVPDVTVTDAVLGTVLQSMRSRLAGRSDRSSAPDVVRLLLRLLGVPHDDVADVLSRVERALAARRDAALAS